MEKFLKYKLSKLAAMIANPYTFFIVLLAVIAWIIYGYFEHYTGPWVTITTLVLSFGTFLIIFIVQFSEENETEALQKKLDAIIKASPRIDNKHAGLEKKFKNESGK